MDSGRGGGGGGLSNWAGLRLRKLFLSLPAGLFSKRLSIVQARTAKRSRGGIHSRFEG